MELKHSSRNQEKYVWLPLQLGGFHTLLPSSRPARQPVVSLVGRERSTCFCNAATEAWTSVSGLGKGLGASSDTQETFLLGVQQPRGFVLWSRIQLPKYVTGKTSFPQGAWGPCLGVALGFSMFPRVLGHEASPSFPESSIAPNCSNFYLKYHTSRRLPVPCRENELLFFLRITTPEAWLWAACSLWTAAPGCSLW